MAEANGARPADTLLVLRIDVDFLVTLQAGRP
jgi:hypothetical protein